MKVILYLVLVSLILCSPNSNNYNTKEQIKKRQEQKEKLFECLNEYGSEKFVKLINENENVKLGDILRKHRVSITRQDKEAIKECRRQILLNSTNIPEKKVYLKRTKTIYEK